MKSFSEKVKEHRGALLLNQKQLAEKSGIGYRSIISYETGRYFPQPAQLYKLAKALGVTPEYLKDDASDNPSQGLDSMEYVEEIRKQNGYQDSIMLEEMLKQNQALFAGGTITEASKDAYFQALMQAYLDCKQAAQQTYGHMKSE